NAHCAHQVIAAVSSVHCPRASPSPVATAAPARSLFRATMSDSAARPMSINTNVVAPPPSSSTTTTTVTSPRNEFFVSQRATDFDVSKIDTLSLEEQEVLASIQELQLQLMQLRAEQEEDSEDEQPATSTQGGPAGASTSQLIVVSNNLPVLLERVPQTGRWKATKTTGGLDKLMCLTGVRTDLNFLWVGWVGQHIPKHEHESVRRLLLQHNCLPVFIEPDVANRHNGFSSEVLWSLFHYVSEPVALTFSSGGNSNFHSTKRYNKQDWRGYEQANESFADAIAEIYNEGDAVWIHDYHLMLLPSLLRQRIPLCHIGWFLHTPFPSSDVYCRLPVRCQLLTGVLQADLVGFQTFDYERHFLSTCQRLLDVECSHRGVRSTVGDREHFTFIGVFPIGINIDPFAKAASSVPTLHRVNELHKKFGNKKIILGIDRLDNIKGIPHKLLAMEMLLEKFPEWQHNVVLVQIGLSSRSGVVEAIKADSALEMSSQSYRNLLSQVNQLVGRINSAFGSLDYAPIHFIHQKSTPHEELCALYDLADVCLVTSTRDGMNLVSHEFVVCQQHFTRRKEERRRQAARNTSSLDALATNDEGIPSPQISPTKILTEWEGEEGGPGVLIVSEFAGCSQSLSGAIVINPWNTEDVALSIHQALSMCRAEREIRQQKLYRYVSTNTATAWSIDFLGDLTDAVRQNRVGSSVLPKLDAKEIVQAYRKAKNRVIILDYDRTLVPTHSLLPLAAVGRNFKALLDTLSGDESNTVFIVSARERKFLETWLTGVRVGVAAEDGFFYRINLQNKRERWKTMSKFQYDVATARSGSGADAAGYLSQSDVQSIRSRSLGSQPSYASYAFSNMRPGGMGGGTGYTDDSFEEEDMSWKDLVLPTMLAFTDRTPGSYIEDKESSLTWHYGDADPHFGSWQAKDLQIILERQLIGTALEVYQGHLWVSVEHEGCTKAKVLEGILKHLSLPKQIANKKGEVDFVLCICDDVTDDQMFQTLNTLANESKERHEKLREAADARVKAAAKQAGRMAAQRARGLEQPSSPTLMRSHSVGTRSLSQGSGLNRNAEKRGRRKSSLSQPASTGSAPSRPKKYSLRFSPDVDASEDDLQEGRDDVDEDNKVSFSLLQKVPVRLAENAAIYMVVVGPDVQHSGGRHNSAYVVDSLQHIRNVLREFADVTRRSSNAAEGMSHSTHGNDNVNAATATGFEQERSDAQSFPPAPLVVSTPPPSVGPALTSGIRSSEF
ncbi:TPA: hypothetical protein N0F65_000702, partial [Lagenidium giganteum]